MRRLLQLNLLLNILLLVAVGWRSVHQPPLNRLPRGEVGPPAGKLSQRPAPPRAPAFQPATPWAAIESADPRRFIANLRALGCPDETIRDIVALRICRAFWDWLVELEAASVRAWDFTRNRDEREWRESWRQQRELRNEMIYTLESLLGQDWLVLSGALLGLSEERRDPTGCLSVEKRRQVREVDLRYVELKRDLARKGSSGPLDAEGAAQLKELERQRQTELAAILSPQELEDYLYRKSPAADYVRQNLSEAKSESEFRAMVKVALDLEMAKSPTAAAQRMGVEPGDPAVTKAEAERKAAFEQRLKEVVGAARMAERQAEEELRLADERKLQAAQQAEEEQRLAAERALQGAQEEQRQRGRFTEMAASIGIAEADAQRFFDRVKELEPILKAKFAATEKSLSGTEEEKRKQMDDLAKAELGEIAVEIIGAKGEALIRKMAEPGR